MARFALLAAWLCSCTYPTLTLPVRGDVPGDELAASGDQSPGDPLVPGGDPSHGDPSYGDPSYGDPSYGDPSYGDPGYGDPGYGDPGYGDPSYGDPSYGDPGYGDPPIQNGDPQSETKCPATQPMSNTSCDDDGLQCAYGADPRDRCRVIATCSGSAWQVFDPQCPLPTLATDCPSTLEEAATGNSCESLDTYCLYGDFACLCTACPPSSPVCGPAVWWCEQPHTDPDCPDDRPMLGTPCVEPGKVCTYVCGDNGAVICTDDTWHSHTAYSCPISSRRYKQNIDYLGTAELARIAEQLLQVRLAEYEYIHRPADRHLGFITEDHPDLPAVGPDGASVDLYTYTSMMLATLQVQARRIEELERDLARLREAVEPPLVCEPPD